MPAALGWMAPPAFVGKFQKPVALPSGSLYLGFSNDQAMETRMPDAAPRQFRTGTALKIAMVDRTRYNEAVADGHYPCAPTSWDGNARAFAEDTDLPALYIFGRELADGVPLRVAGHRACAFAACARQHPEAKVITRVVTRVDTSFAPSDGFDRNGDAIVSMHDYHIGNLRALLAKRIDAELNVHGVE